MIALPLTAADSVLAAATLAGILATIVVIEARSTADGVAARFVFALALVAGIFAARLLAWHLHAGLFDSVGGVFAAWIPLAMLLLLEGLQRRHAPRAAKLGALAAGLLCTVLAVFNPFPDAPNYVLLGAQLIAFIVIYWLALTGANDGLTQSESRALSRLRLALPILLVCVASDYGLFAQWVPIRLSAIGILVFCWLAIGASSATSSRWDALLVLGATAIAALLVGLAAWAMTASGAIAIQAGAMALCAALLALVVNEAARAFAASRRDDVLRALARAELEDVPGFIASVTAGSQLQGTTLIEGEALADFDGAALGAAFARHPVMERRDLEGQPEDTRQQLESLFVTYDATHLLLVSAAPLRLAAATLAAIGSNSALRTELMLVQRMARLISEREGRADGAA